MNLLYICSSQFSGSTLTSFLLNNHSSIASIGHTTGWRYSDEEDFRCSCGEKLSACPLFTRIENAFIEARLPYDPQNFGTEFRLSATPRVNQLLVGPIPLLKMSTVENIRDRIVSAVPGFRRTLHRQLLANFVLMRTVCESLNATVYLDNSHSPYRMRILGRDDRFTVFPVHLIRDPRGVSLSLMTNSGYSAEAAIDSWVMHQSSIFRMGNEIRPPLILGYESLCLNTQAELEKLHHHAGLPYEDFRGNFRESEHHILGNRMRLADGQIRLDERWKKDLSAADLEIITRRLLLFQEKQPEHPLSAVVEKYLSAAA